MRRDILRLGRSALIYGAGNVLIRGISLLLLPVVTTYLTPDDYGISSILGVLAFFQTPVFALGLSGALGIVYFERGDDDRKAATIWTAFVILTMSGGLLLVSGLVAGDAIAAALFADLSTPYDLSYLVAVSLATAGMSIASQPLLIHLQLEERAKAFVVLTAASSLLSIGLSVLLIVVLGRGVAGFLEAGLVAQAMTLLAALAITVPRMRFILRRQLAGELLRLGIPLMPSFIAVLAMQQGNKLILQGAESVAAVGVYTVGFNIGLVATIIVSGFTTAWYPFFSSYMERQDQGPPIFARIMTYYLLGAGVLSLFFFILARPVVLILTQPSFHDAYVAVGPSALAQVLIGVHSILLAGMYLAKDVRFAVVVQGAAAIASVVINIVLIGVIGIRGASIGLALGFAIMVILQYGWNRWRGYLDVPYEWRRIGLFSALYAVIAGFSLFDRDWPLSTEVPVAVLACVIVSVGAVALLSRRERSQIFELIRLRIQPHAGTGA
jgi:O-antigen/teichoic acid export membrane protein